MAGRNYDYPRPLRGRMAKNALKDMAQHASTLERKLQDDDKLPAWVDYYIATAADRMHTVGGYMSNEMEKIDDSYGQYEGAVIRHGIAVSRPYAGDHDPGPAADLSLPETLMVTTKALGRIALYLGVAMVGAYALQQVMDRAAPYRY